MGMVKQHLLEQADKQALTTKLEQMAEYYGMSTPQVEMMCQQAAAQKGIPVKAQILDDFEDIDAVIAFETTLEKEQDSYSRQSQLPLNVDEFIIK
jgi:antitoxin component of RelBE/YafQ-DinJ toxin-antitoxin module